MVSRNIKTVLHTRLSAKPRSRSWTWTFAIAGFIVGCETHIQAAIVGGGTPVLFLYLGVMIGGAIDRLQSQHYVGRVALGVVTDFACVFLIGMGIGLALGIVVFLGGWFQPADKPGRPTEDYSSQAKTPADMPLKPGEDGRIGGLVVVGGPDEFEVNTVTERFRVRGFFVARDMHSFLALVSECQHCGTPLNWLQAEMKFKCPSCGSGFKINGEHFEGPATRGMGRFSISFRRDGLLQVDLSDKLRDLRIEGPPIEEPPDPPTSDSESPPTKAAQDEDLQDLEKRVHEEFVAQCQENDRLYQQMVKANPRDIRAWQLLSWNEAYNLSVTSDDVQERYAHVKRGIEHLIEGLRHNPTEARLYCDIGRHLSNKIGHGDERQPYRALFRGDKEFHKLLAGYVEVEAAAGPDGLPDNFLVAGRWSQKAIAIVEQHGTPPDSPEYDAPLFLYSRPAMCQTNHARAIEKEGHFGEAAVNAWQQALTMWEALGEREFVGDDGAKYRLKDNETAREVIHYDYWKNRCQVEPTERVLAARQAVYRAEEYLTQFKGLGRWPWDENLATRRVEFTDEARQQAKQLYDQAFRAWAEVYKEHSWLIDHEDELDLIVWLYQKRVLKSEPLPDDFPLRHVPSLLPRTP